MIIHINSNIDSLLLQISMYTQLKLQNCKPKL